MPTFLMAVVKHTHLAAPEPWRRVTLAPNLRLGVDGPSKATNLSPATNCAQLEMVSVVRYLSVAGVRTYPAGFDLAVESRDGNVGGHLWQPGWSALLCPRKGRELKRGEGGRGEAEEGERQRRGAVRARAPWRPRENVGVDSP